MDGGRGERVLRVPPAPPQELCADIVRPRHQERGGVRRVLLPVEERLQGGGQELQEYLQLRGGNGGGAGMFGGGGNDEAVSQIYDILCAAAPIPPFRSFSAFVGIPLYEPEWVLEVDSDFRFNPFEDIIEILGQIVPLDKVGCSHVPCL